MSNRLIKQVFDNSDNIISNGFVKLDKKPSKTTFSDVLKEYKTSIIMVDTHGWFIKDAMIEINSSDHFAEMLIIGLVNNEMLLKIKQDGIKDGFYRTTTEKINVGLIILNKKKIYAVFDINNIFPIVDSYASKEIFEMINHIIWSKTDKEYFGSLREVNDIRLSVIAPELARAVFPDALNKYEYCSDSLGFEAESIILVKPSSITHFKSVVLENTSVQMYGKLNEMNIEVFPNKYYPFDFGDNHFDYESFANKTIGSLVEKEIIVSNKRQIVKEKDVISEKESVYLDELDSYSPDFEKVVNQYSGYAREIEVIVDAESKAVDSSYKLSSRYEIIKNVNQKIENGLQTMEKLFDSTKENEKRIDSVRLEKNLSLKIKMFNELVKNEEFGLASLNTKKSPVSTISNVNESDLVVPNELIGTLYSKNNTLFLATTLQRLDEAKKWLKDNKTEAHLIEA